MSDTRTQALDTIRALHRTLAAVIHNLKNLLADTQAGRMALDLPLLWSMVYCIDAFPDRLHHTKEDGWRFRLLRQRIHEADTLIDEMQRQHSHEPQVLGEIWRWLGNVQADVPDSMKSLMRTVPTHADFTWRHLKVEEHELIPLAGSQLTNADWNEIAQAFAQNADSLSDCGQAKAFYQQLRDMVQRTPGTLGLA